MVGKAYKDTQNSHYLLARISHGGVCFVVDKSQLSSTSGAEKKDG